ncbi:hypothetical protein CN354_07940 [Bacillus cereus]|nr:hypothetical protein CN354_07940 [Bacillus cereus]WJE55658.1 hypothetical protein QRE66_28055 [Bacillus cereus]
MSNYYADNRWYVYKTAWPSLQQVPEPMYKRSTNRRFDLNHQTAIVVNLGQGFKRYMWSPAVRIKSNEYVEFRLAAQENETVISVGFNTNPLQNIYAVQSSPIYQHIMAITLHNAEIENVESEVSLWLVVKELSY